MVFLIGRYMKKSKQTVLAIMAHPGDAAVLCAGTLAKFARLGARTAIACVSDGAGGNKLAPMSPAKLAAMRQRQEQSAARTLDADLHWLGFTDGALFRTDDYIFQLVDVIRQVQPTLIFTHHPDDYHSDNQYVSKAAFIAANIAPIANLKTTRQPHDLRPALFYTESWISKAFIPTDYVDITATFALKTKAVAANKVGVSWLRDFDKISLFDLLQTNAKTPTGPIRPPTASFPKVKSSRDAHRFRF
jgi:LmbE family N-acetylglucosaminyl deacetylase